MNIRNAFILLVGVLIGVLGCVITLLFVSDKAPIKDLLPSIITGIVTFAALTFGYLNNKEQREVQLKVAIEKEWINDVRKHIAIIFENSISIGIYYKRKEQNLPAHSTEELGNSFDRVSNSTAVLGLLLDNKMPLEKKVLDSVGNMHIKAYEIKTEQDMKELIILGKVLIYDAHELIAPKLK